jgi:hypothetical protein
MDCTSIVILKELAVSGPLVVSGLYPMLFHLSREVKTMT